MIQITNISKSFDDIKAVDDITVDIGEQIVFGLLGTNGAGKSTLLRMVSGILKPDSGNITVDDMGVLDNEEAKKNLVFISASPYVFANSNPIDVMSPLCIE